MYQYLLILLSCFISQFHTSLCLPSRSRYALAERDSDECIHFEVDLTWEEDNAVGIPKQTILVNGTSPGPVLYMALGDTVEFVVNNYLPFGTTIHFHGITQLNTPWSDGVPGVSQMPIAPGATFVYTWTADEYGQYFYHAHHRGQIDDGLVGAIIISPPANELAPFSLISDSANDVAAMKKAELAPHPLIVSDWKAISFEDLFAMEVVSGVDIICPDTIIINGKVGFSSEYCTAVSR
jgi:FtsP/CotA-like multicopper oxidase with cupredoxin domain